MSDVAFWEHDYLANGCLPSASQVRRPERTPLTPDQLTIKHAMGTDSYPEAMRRAAALLNIYGGRYGLPECARPDAA